MVKRFISIITEKSYFLQAKNKKIYHYLNKHQNNEKNSNNFAYLSVQKLRIELEYN